MDKKVDGSVMTNRELKADDTAADLIESWKKTNGIIAGVFTLSIIAVFPLFFRNYYFDILKAKYMFYYGTVILMMVVSLIAAIFYLWQDGARYQWKNVKKIREGLSRKKLRKSDWAMIAFLGAVTISTLQSEYLYESFWGNEGRYMGMFLILMYGGSYFIISRFLIFKQWYLDVFLVAGMIACIIGILHYFNIDPIGFKIDIDADYYEIFASTIGNINTYTSYVALISGMGCVLFAVEKNAMRRIWYLLTVIISIFALITGISDNAYLAILALFGFLPLYLFNNLSGVKKYILLVSVLFTEFLFIDFIGQRFADKVLKINGLFNVIAGYDKLSYFVMILWIVTVLLYILDVGISKKNGKHSNSNIGRWLWLGIIVVVLLQISYVLYDVNIAGNTDRYGSLSKYLLINDDWGTHRWYIWRIGMESYQKFPLIHKIFGYGPDTFGIITIKNYYEEMISRYNEKFDSAHNEYLQYLITIGIVGLIAYLSLLFTSIMQMLRSSKHTPVLMGIVFALLCYGAQAAVNISVPIVAPIMMTLLMMGVAAERDTCEAYDRSINESH